MGKILFSFVAIFLLQQASAQYSPCKNYWKYILGSDQSTQGMLTLPPKSYQQHHLKIVLTVDVQLPTSYVGSISLLKDAQSAANDVANGRPILYRIVFPVQNPLPKLTKVYYNNELLCSEQPSKQNYGYTTTINLDHKLTTNIPLNLPQIPQQNQVFNRAPEPAYEPQSIQQAVFNSQSNVRPQAPAPISRPSNFEQVASNTNDANFQCGVPMTRPQQTTGLIVNGKVATRGQFPWLAAFYYRNTRQSGFICGGSLVSQKIVITASHCIQDKGSPDRKKNAAESFFSLGKHYITQEQDDSAVVLSGVSQFIMHPDYNAHVESYDADIAIAVLQRTIPFTNFIQPICLWSQTSSYNDIINRQGVVAGWGKTESSISASERLNYVELPVVSESTCLRSNGGFLKITSPRTFCVGARDGRSPCSGDSGGGFIVKDGGKWYLRGIVSSALFDQELQMCDAKNYAVFTDVAQFKDWIKQNMDRYG